MVASIIPKRSVKNREKIRNKVIQTITVEP